MDANEAARRMREEHDPGYRWIAGIGVGANDTLVVYSKVKKPPKLPDVYHGFPVQVRYSGEIRLATAE